MIQDRKPPRPLTVDMGSRSCGVRQRIHGRLQPMDSDKPSGAIRLAIIVGMSAAAWLAIAAVFLEKFHG